MAALCFSDVPENTVFGWKEGDTAAKVVLKPSGSVIDPTGQGSNGLAVDAQGHLILCQHGERRIARLEKDGRFTPLAGKYEGKRFNSPKRSRDREERHDLLHRSALRSEERRRGG
jgi:gluconolactonase